MPHSFESSAFAKSTPERSTDPLESALRESGAVVLESAEHRTAPRVAADQFPNLSEKTRHLMQELADRSATYLDKPIILDTFEDHELRRAWRTTIREHYSSDVVAFFENNRLRLNALQPLLFKLSQLRTALTAEASSSNRDDVTNALEAFFAVTGEIPSLGERYRNLTLEGKVRFVQEISAASRAYLSQVAGMGDLAEAA